MPTEEEVFDVLKAVVDPEIGVDIVNMGLIYGVEIKDDRVDIKMTLTSMGCPATALIEFQAKEAVGTLAGVTDVHVQFTFDPPWSPEKMSEEGRDQLQALGLW